MHKNKPMDPAVPIRGDSNKDNPVPFYIKNFQFQFQLALKVLFRLMQSFGNRLASNKSNSKSVSLLTFQWLFKKCEEGKIHKRAEKSKIERFGY